MKKQKIKLNVKPIWAIGKGHNSHLSGGGQHDSRPKRLRTRQAANRQALKDWQSHLTLRVWLGWLQSAKYGVFISGGSLKRYWTLDQYKIPIDNGSGIG